MKVLLDTSVLVPALVPALPQHERAAPHLEEAARGESTLIVSSHALAECYASLTALPLSPRVTPEQAIRLIQENVASTAEKIFQLGPKDYLAAIQRTVDLELRSGAIYDALHVACAEKASAEELRTFNGEDFRRMPPDDPTRLMVL